MPTTVHLMYQYKHYMPTFKFPHNSHSSGGGRWKIIWHVLSGWHFLIWHQLPGAKQKCGNSDMQWKGVNKQSRDCDMVHATWWHRSIWSCPQPCVCVSLQKGLRTQLDDHLLLSTWPRQHAHFADRMKLSFSVSSVASWWGALRSGPDKWHTMAAPLPIWFNGFSRF